MMKKQHLLKLVRKLYPNYLSSGHLDKIYSKTHAESLFHKSCFHGPLALITPPSHLSEAISSVLDEVLVTAFAAGDQEEEAALPLS